MRLSTLTVSAMLGLASFASLPASAAPVDANGFPVYTATQAMPPLAVKSRPAAVASDADAALSVAQPNALAPALSREAVFAVGSTLYGGWEYMTSLTQASTVGNHGGAMLRVVVQELGYGGTPTVTIGGTIMPSSANYENDQICVVNGSYTSPCPAGYTVVGYYRYFNLDGQPVGKFTYQNTSLNAPKNTLSTQIVIK